MTALAELQIPATQGNNCERWQVISWIPILLAQMKWREEHLTDSPSQTALIPLYVIFSRVFTTCITVTWVRVFMLHSPPHPMVSAVSSPS
jgi:hypothetical protein